MMNILAGAAVLALLATPASADEGDCQSMISSFDLTAMPFPLFGDADKFLEAKKHRDSGASELAKGNEKGCLAHLRLAHAALKDNLD